MQIQILVVLLMGWFSLLLVAAAPSRDTYSLSTFEHPLPRKVWLELETLKFLDFQNGTKQISEEVKTYIETKLNGAATTFPSVAVKIGEFKEAMSNVVLSSKKFLEDLESHFKENLTLDQISHPLSEEFDLILQELQREFPEELSGNADSRHAERVRMISWVMNRAESSFVKVGNLWGIPESHTRMKFQEIKLHVMNIVLVAGHITDRHPILTEIILLSGAVILMPESPLILRPFLRLFGFGPYGPVKGSLAAWAQGRFFGGYIRSGSWFSRLQSAGMLKSGSWAKLWKGIV